MLSFCDIDEKWEGNLTTYLMIRIYFVFINLYDIFLLRLIMKLIICGLPGTGKTSLVHKIFDEYKYRIISDWDIFEKYNIVINKIEDKNIVSEKYSKLLLDYINNQNDNIIVDLEYSISPSDFVKYNKYSNIQIVYLGFVSVEVKTLFDLFRNSESNCKYADDELKLLIKFYKEMSVEYKQQCDKLDIKFFNINKDRKIMQQKILDYLDVRRYV